MRIIFCLLFILSSQVSLAAPPNRNPMMRTCMRVQGQFWIVYGQDQELPRCLMGAAGIGAEALMSFKNGNGNFLSVRAYKQGSGSNCEQAGAVTVVGQDSDKVSFEVCQFSDGSLIERQTLLRGKGSVENRELDRALSIRN